MITATVLVTFVVALALSGLADPRGTWMYWTHCVLFTDRVGSSACGGAQAPQRELGDR